MTALASRRLGLAIVSVGIGAWWAAFGCGFDLLLVWQLTRARTGLWLHGTLEALPIIIAVGALYGVFWSVFAVLLLARKSLAQVTLCLAIAVSLWRIVTSVVSVLSLLPSNRLTDAFCTVTPHLVLVLACLGCWRLLPDVPVLCGRCGYNLTRRRSPICPECGDAGLHDRSRLLLRLAILPILGVCATLVVLFASTRSSSCGYQGYRTCIAITQGTLFISGHADVYEGWFLSSHSFIPMDGYILWPVFTDRFILIPLWAPLLALLLPAMIAWRRGSTAPRGYCRSCGYCLRGNESGRCPECGTPVRLHRP